MLAELGQEIDSFVEESKAHLGFWLSFIGILWGFNLLNWTLGGAFNRLGIYPRQPLGLIGIAFAPFLHGGVNHLFFNTIPLFMLGLFMLGDGMTTFILANIMIMFFSGLAVWLIGRKGIHIGASGVISGYFGYVLASAYETPTLTTIALGVVALYYFGGILFSLFPSEERVSWEGHLTGFLAGIGSRLGMGHFIFWLST